jgi:hypothetical protein
MRSSWARKSFVERSTRYPAKDSSLSRVPPENPSPRPLIFATGAPQAATSGATASVVLSPTPPVECLSTTRPNRVRSRRWPDRTIAIVSAAISRASMPRKTTAMQKALIW